MLCAAGPTQEGCGKGVAVRIPGNEVSDVGCLPTDLSRTPPPPLPGGYAAGEQVYYTGESARLADDVKLTYGQAVEVLGPATAATHVGKGLCVIFPGNRASIDCHLANLSGTPPPPGGLPTPSPPPGGETAHSRDEQRRRLRHKLELKRQGRQRSTPDTS